MSLPSSSKITDNQPVLIAVAAVSQKIEDTDKLVDGMDAVGLMIKACQEASEQINCPDILTQIDDISVPQGLWGFNNPASAIANAIGAPHAFTVMAKIGVLQQGLMARACDLIQRGEKEVCIVAGGEAKYRDIIAGFNGVSLPQRPSQIDPDLVLEPDEELWLAAESDAGLGMPVGYYALMDSAFRAKNEIPIGEYRDAIADLYQGFSEIASENPDAWKRRMVKADDIRNASDKNPMLAFPYTKSHNSSWNVDQASALIFCSIKKAKALGIDEKHWVYPVATTECNQMLAVSQRPDLASCPGARLAGKAAFDLANITIDQVDLIELYSCFPIGVLSFAAELGLSPEKSVTTTGGMPFAGGPLNNYVLQATVTTVKKLQQLNRGYALVSNISGMNTKQAFGLYSLQPYAYQFLDVTDQVEAVNPPKEVNNDFDGEAKIVAATVLFQKNNPERVVIIAESDTHLRAVAFSQDPLLLALFQEKNGIGLAVSINDGQFTLL